MERPVKGDALMIFYGDNYSTMRYARSHSLEISLSTSNAQYKNITQQRTSYPVPKAGLWTMSAEIIYTNEDYFQFMQYLIANEKVIVMYGQATNYNGEPNDEWEAGYGYRGKALVTNVQADAPTGDVATLTIELTGVTPLMYCHYTDEWGTSTEWSPSKLDPDISFEHDSDQVTISQSNLYQISDLLNPNELSVRFVVLPYKGRVIKDIELVETRDILSDSQIITDIMLSTLAPGTYTILAIFDGDDVYNPAQVEYTITILEDGSEPTVRPAEPIDTPEDQQKYDPIFYFPSSQETRSQNTDNSYRIQSLVNPANLPVTWQLPSGVSMTPSSFIISDQGSYRIVASFTGNERYNPAQTEYILVITEPEIEIEKQDVVLQWVNPPQSYAYTPTGQYALPELYNPQNVPVTISCNNSQVTVSGNNIITSATTGMYIAITATFAGNDYYYPASAQFTTQILPKELVDPQIYWSNTTMNVMENQSHLYQLPSLNNPYNLPVTYEIYPSGVATIVGDAVSVQGHGTFTITASYPGDSDYLSSSSTLTITISEHQQIAPTLYWSESSMTYNENRDGTDDAGVYHLPALVNPDNLPVTITDDFNGGDYVNGDFVIPFPSTPINYPVTIHLTATFAGDYDYYPATSTMTIVIMPHVGIDPEFYWDPDTVSSYISLNIPNYEEWCSAIESYYDYYNSFGVWPEWDDYHKYILAAPLLRSSVGLDDVRYGVSQYGGNVNADDTSSYQIYYPLVNSMPSAPHLYQGFDFWDDYGYGFAEFVAWYPGSWTYNQAFAYVRFNATGRQPFYSYELILEDTTSYVNNSYLYTMPISYMYIHYSNPNIRIALDSQNTYLDHIDWTSYVPTSYYTYLWDPYDHRWYLSYYNTYSGYAYIKSYDTGELSLYAYDRTNSHIYEPWISYATLNILKYDPTYTIELSDATLPYKGKEYMMPIKHNLSNGTIYCHVNTEAESFAMRHYLPIIYLDDSESTSSLVFPSLPIYNATTNSYHNANISITCPDQDFTYTVAHYYPSQGISAWDGYYYTYLTVPLSASPGYVPAGQYDIYATYSQGWAYYPSETNATMTVNEPIYTIELSNATLPQNSDNIYPMPIKHNLSLGVVYGFLNREARDFAWRHNLYPYDWENTLDWNLYLSFNSIQIYNVTTNSYHKASISITVPREDSWDEVDFTYTVAHYYPSQGISSWNGYYYCYLNVPISSPGQYEIYASYNNSETNATLTIV